MGIQLQIDSSWSNNMRKRFTREDIISIKRKALHADFIIEGDQFMVSPITLKQQEVEELIAKLKIIENLIFDLPNRLFGSNDASFMEALGIDERIIQFLLNCHIDWEKFPIRWDLIPTINGWKVIEINAGYCLGGLTGYQLNDAYYSNSEYQSAYSDYMPNSFVSINENLNLTSKDHLVLLETDAMYKKYHFYLAALARGLQSTSKATISSASLSKLKLVDKQLMLNNKIIDVIMPMFTVEEFLQNEHSKNLLSAIQNNCVRNALNFYEFVFSNKGVFALLCAPINWQYFSLEEVSAVNELIANTSYLTSANQIITGKDSLVLKPCDKYGGEGVVCGWDSSQQEWVQAVNSAIGSDDCYIIQSRAIGLECSVSLVDKDDRVMHTTASLVLGITTLNNTLIGGFARCIHDRSFGSVANVDLGAACGILTFDRGSEL